MTLEEAIKTAIEYEIKVRDAYLNSLDSIKDETGRHVFEVLGKEEQGHVDYLECKLDEWQKTGMLSSSDMDTVVPAKAAIEQGVSRLDAHASATDFETEREMLKKALAMEQETSDFYRKIVGELDTGAELFNRFLEIEDGHVAIVQAELDYLNNTGRFFDFEEFNQEH
ncbi:MAG: hypothetical protein KOO62_07940 [candidate division Zixibacteria bacterium]|nr:hypothetical protein [candidate division Zixibacteria bacterium]